jgi:hypothetical protein
LVVAGVVVVGILSYFEQNLGQPPTGHGEETMKIVPAETGYEHAIWKV